MSRLNQFLLFLIVISNLWACNQQYEKSNKSTMFQELSSSYTNIKFNNKIVETEYNNHLVWESIYNGAGVGIADLNNDGLLDIYFCGNMSADKLYLNKGNMTFEDVTENSNIKENDWSSGVVMADVNNDGLIDIYVSKMSWEKDNVNVNARKNKLYINRGEMQFVESADKYGIADKGHTTQSSFFDFNQDGLLDLYVMNAPSHRYDQKLDYMKSNSIPYDFKDHLYIQKENHFIDITNEAIGNQQHAYGLGLSTVDINQDGWTDIYVSNDFEKPDLMLINDHNGGFKNLLTTKLKHISYSSMGMDIADINNDNWFDIAVLDMQSNDHVRSKTNMPSMNIRQFWKNVGLGYHYQYMSNMLQLNNGTGKYSEIAQMSGLASTDWSWSILLVDIDNDSYRDVLITNGINRNIKDNDFNMEMQKTKKTKDFSFLKLAMKTKVEKIKNFVFKNDSASLHFTDVSDSWGFNHDGFSFGAAYGDLDNDGDIDVVVNNSNEEASIYKNLNINNNHSLRVVTKDGNKIIWNSKAKLYYKGGQQIAELHNVRGYQSCSEPVMHFGLGNVTAIDSLVIDFPGGYSKLIRQPTVDSLYIVDIASSELLNRQDKKSQAIFKQTTNSSGLLFLHKENRYNDFLQQILIPHMESKNGPFVSVGDLDGNDMDDVYIGGAKGQAGQISLQNKNGLLVTHPVPSFVSDIDKEDMGSAFFDIDNDGDLDLYVVSGGSEHYKGSEAYQDRLYLNDANAGYINSDQILPKSNGSIVVPIDVDRDGFLDLFVGGRMEGLKYPYPGTSHLLMNENENLEDVETFEYKNIGMVTSACVSDINSDGWDDLIVVGEWMQPKILINNKGKFEDKTTQWLPNAQVGWWFEVKVFDIDGDGIKEILLGNIGMNNKYKASPLKPLKVYSADFDKNNSNDIVLTKQTKYGEVPVRGRACSSEQMPYIENKFKTYGDFAHAEIVDILGSKNIENALVLEATNFKSGYLKFVEKSENTKAHFVFHAFPNMAQISSIQGIEVLDVNGDHQMDIVIAGNLFDAEVETVRHDASYGLVMLGNKKGDFKTLLPIESGFDAGSNVKDLAKIQLGNKTSLIVTNNSFWTQVFQLQ